MFSQPLHPYNHRENVSIQNIALYLESKIFHFEVNSYIKCHGGDVLYGLYNVFSCEYAF